MDEFIIPNRGPLSRIIKETGEWEYHYYHTKNYSTFAPIKLHLNVANNPHAIKYIQEVLSGNENLMDKLKFVQKKNYDNLPNYIMRIITYKNKLNSQKLALEEEDRKWLEQAPQALGDAKRLLDYAQTTIYFREDHINKILTGDEKMLEFLITLNRLANKFSGPATNEWRYQKAPALDKILFTIGNNDLGEYVPNELSTDNDTKKKCNNNIALLNDIVKSLKQNIKHQNTTATLKQQQQQHRHLQQEKNIHQDITYPNYNLNKPLLKTATRHSNSTIFYNAFTGALSGGIIAATVTGIMIATALTTLPWLGPATVIGAAIGLSARIVLSRTNCGKNNTPNMK